VFGEALAILAGDALLTWAFELLARDIRPPERAASCCCALATAAGAAGMVGGQVEDLENSKIGAPPAELSVLESIHRRKTGAMFVVSLTLGGLVAGADRRQMALLEAFGSRLGLAFQIMDDLLDIHGQQNAMGKRVGKDAGRGKLTFPGLLGAAESGQRAEKLICDACESLEPLGKAADELRALAGYVVERNR
jgi:geranylgeranyl diphosphate synthase type II